MAGEGPEAAALKAPPLRRDPPPAMLSRHFLGWDRPLTEAVCGYLLDGLKGAVPDLEGPLLVVPTRQAGRRLRQALARRQDGPGVLGALVVTPAWLLPSSSGPAGLACTAAVLAAWARTVMDADPAEYPHLFPVAGAGGDFTVAMRHGEAIERLRSELLDGGLSIPEVPERGGGALREKDRWTELARLEDSYLRTLSSRGLRDPVAFRREWVAEPSAGEGVKRSVIAGTPDPQPLAVQALSRLADRLAVEVLVYAPPELADDFDSWGRPLPGAWGKAPIDLPEEGRDLLLAGSPDDQARIVAELLRAEGRWSAPAEAAIGVPDRELAPFLEHRLGEEGRGVFDPAGRPLASHPLCRLMNALRRLVDHRSLRSLGSLLREADFLEAIGREEGAVAEEVLAQLDELQNLCLPEGLDALSAALGRSTGFHGLRGAVRFAEALRRDLRSGRFAEGVRKVLTRVYGRRSVDLLNPADREFAAAAGMVEEALREQEEGGLEALGLDWAGRFALLMKVLVERVLEEEEGEERIDLDGWLELPWNDAPFMIVTGFNEGRVPQTPPVSPFLTPSLRRALGLPGEAERTARDAYQMSCLIESRRHRGRVCFVAGKKGRGGDPLQPSRLLFRCSGDSLLPRAARLFGDPGTSRRAVAASVGLRLDPLAPLGGTLEGGLPKALRVTQLGDYLRCPFRFFLRHLLGMEHRDGRKRELDARDFGGLMHHCLQGLGEGKWRASSDEEGLRRMLWSRCDRWAGERLGGDPPLVAEAQLTAARERLAAAAREHARGAVEGWEVIGAERVVEAEVGGVPIRGRVDRIDRHRRTGEIRILDYKTSDRPREPEKEHLAPLREGREWCEAPGTGRRRRCWADLQLPLYQALLGDVTGEGVSVGYFCLPKGVDETGVRVWRGFDADLAASALECAAEVVHRIGEGIFWPPAATGMPDDYGELFYAAPELVFDARQLTGKGGGP